MNTTDYNLHWTSNLNWYLACFVYDFGKVTVAILLAFTTSTGWSQLLANMKQILTYIKII